MNELGLFERKSNVYVSSRIIAERFNKEHSSVLKTIEGVNRKDETGQFKHINGLVDDLRESSVNALDYFIKGKYRDERNREQPEYLITRDGFVLLGMGFTGIDALRWKLKYIAAFNAMEAALRERQSTDWLQTRIKGKLIRRDETDAIQQLIPYAEEQGSKNMRTTAYVTYTKLVNSLVGIESGQRDICPFKTLSTIAFLEDMILHTVAEEMQKGTYYKEIYKKCKANGEQIVRFAYLPKMAA